MLVTFGYTLLFRHFAFFFFNDTATTEIYTLSLHDALPICPLWHRSEGGRLLDAGLPQQVGARQGRQPRARVREMRDRKSTRLNSSHGYISYAVFCLKKKTLKRRTVRLCPGVTRQRRIAAQR